MVKVPANLLSCEGSLPGLQSAAFLLCLHIVSLLCMQRERKQPLMFLPLLIRASLQQDQGPTFMTTFNLNYLPKPLPLNLTHIWDQGCSVQILEEQDLVHNTHNIQRSLQINRLIDFIFPSPFLPSVVHCLVTKSCLTLQPLRLQHTRLPCPSPSPRVCSNSCPLSR